MASHSVYLACHSHFISYRSSPTRRCDSFPTRRSSDLLSAVSTRPNLAFSGEHEVLRNTVRQFLTATSSPADVRRVMETADGFRSEEHTSELQSHVNLVCRLLVEKKYLWQL